MPLFGTSPDVKAARQEYEQILKQLVSDAGDHSVLLAKLPDLVEAAELSGRRARKSNAAALRAIAQRVLEDEQLTEAEERQFLGIAQALGVTQEQLDADFRNEMKLLVVGRANDGRLPVIPDPNVMTRPGEVVHVEVAAALTKEVVHREWRGGSSGVSVPIGFGIRVRTGSVRGRSVVVGTSIQNVDQGVLAITSTRTLYAGARKTVECRHSKLVSLNVYKDGISIGVSNRQNATVLRVDDGPFVAAIINAAAQSEIGAARS